MKYQQGKIKREHGIMKEFELLLFELQKNPAVTRLIPGRISRQQKGTGELHFSMQYPTLSGRKCLMKKGSTAQELFVIGNKDVLTQSFRDMSFGTNAVR